MDAVTLALQKDKWRVLKRPSETDYLFMEETDRNGERGSALGTENDVSSTDAPPHAGTSVSPAEV